MKLVRRVNECFDHLIFYDQDKERRRKPVGEKRTDD